MRQHLPNGRAELADLSSSPERPYRQTAMRRRARWVLLLPAVLLGLAHADRDADSISNWRLASRAPVGLAPDPADTPEAVVQVYAARAARWRGYLSLIHI